MNHPVCSFWWIHLSFTTAKNILMLLQFCVGLLFPQTDLKKWLFANFMSDTLYTLPEPDYKTSDYQSWAITYQPVYLGKRFFNPHVYPKLRMKWNYVGEVKLGKGKLVLPLPPEATLWRFTLHGRECLFLFWRVCKCASFLLAFIHMCVSPGRFSWACLHSESMCHCAQNEKCCVYLQCMHIHLQIRLQLPACLCVRESGYSVTLHGWKI